MIHAPPFLFAAEVCCVCAAQVAELSSGDGSKRITSPESQMQNKEMLINICVQFFFNTTTSVEA